MKQVQKPREFTHDWFTGHAKPMFEALTQHVPQKGPINVLEIGAFEGRATCWMLDNWISDRKESHISVVEPFTGAADHEGMEIDWKAVKSRFMKNTDAEDNALIVQLMEMTSDKALPLLRSWGETYDFVYIDGSHRARDVMHDAVLAWGMMDKGAILLFDDYLWGDRSQPLETPKPAIDAFCLLYGDELEIVATGYQLAVRKIK
tara:strand:- start:15000 stop:15611 length:612 start_codon:yes stop_codon:yes gene_type:complete